MDSALLSFVITGWVLKFIPLFRISTRMLESSRFFYAHRCMRKRGGVPSNVEIPPNPNRHLLNADIFHKESDKDLGAGARR